MDPVLVMIEDIAFLALVCWREARGEPREGKTALCYSILNRSENPAWWGDSILAVIFKKWQYSSMTDPHDPQLVLWPPPTDRLWQECLQVAHDVFNKLVANPAPHADSYYADTMPSPPKWADPQKFVVQIGHHRFYNLNADHEKEALS